MESVNESGLRKLLFYELITEVQPGFFWREAK